MCSYYRPWHIVASAVTQEELIACLKTLRGGDHRGAGIPRMMMFMIVWHDAWFMLYALLWICSKGIWHRQVGTWRAFCTPVVKTNVAESQLAKKCLVAYSVARGSVRCRPRIRRCRSEDHERWVPTQADMSKAPKVGED